MNKTPDIARAADFAQQVVSDYEATPDNLIAILQDIQAEYRYLPEAALKQVAGSLDLPLIQVYGVATFFKAFSLTPRGKHTVTVCMGTACHVRGGRSVLEEMERQIGIGNGQTTRDGLFSLESVNCLGACALGPVVVVDGRYHAKMSAGKIKKLLDEYRKDATRSAK